MKPKKGWEKDLDPRCSNCLCWTGAPQDAEAPCVRFPPTVHGRDEDTGEVIQDDPVTPPEHRCFEHRYKTN